MKRVKLEKDDYISPDGVRIASWGIDIGFVSQPDAVAFSFNGEDVLYDSKARNHGSFHDKDDNGSLYDFRYFPAIRSIVGWFYTGDTTIILHRLYQALRNKRFKYVGKNKHMADKNPFDGIDLSSVSFLYEIPGETAVMCGLDEVNEDDGIESNWDKRLFHLAPPSEKMKLLETDAKLRTERSNYFKEGDRAWVKKHGNIDPAHWHLLMYEE